jgi:hypothetical protein
MSKESGLQREKPTTSPCQRQEDKLRAARASPGSSRDLTSPTCRYPTSGFNTANRKSMVVREVWTRGMRKYGISGKLVSARPIVTHVLSTSCRIVALRSRCANQVFHGLCLFSYPSPFSLTSPSRLRGSQPSPPPAPPTPPRTTAPCVSIPSPPEQSAAHRPSGATRYRLRKASYASRDCSSDAAKRCKLVGGGRRPW